MRAHEASQNMKMENIVDLFNACFYVPFGQNR